MGGITMNEIYTRVSIRKFEDRPVEPEKITQLLKAAMQAPSAGNQQPWEFYVVTDKEKIKALSESNPYAGCAAGAPVGIVPCYKTEGARFPMYCEIDLSIATENLWLEAASLGLDRYCSAERQNGKGRSRPRKSRRASRFCACSCGLSCGDKGTAGQV